MRNILDLFLPKETKNLMKINKLAIKFNQYIDKTYLKLLKKKFEKIKTKEHTDKIELYIYMINDLLGNKK